jgi:hypothetical protein
MYAIRITLSACVIVALAACTTRPDPQLTLFSTVAIPPPEVSIELPLEQKLPRDPGLARACRLSSTKSCMELDPRPFEPCLTGTRSCREKGQGGVTLLEAPERRVFTYPVLRPR